MTEPDLPCCSAEKPHRIPFTSEFSGRHWLAYGEVDEPTPALTWQQTVLKVYEALGLLPLLKRIADAIAGWIDRHPRIGRLLDAIDRRDQENQ